MERIYYASGVVQTGSSISRALLSYAELLSRHKASATVDIPVRRPDGSEGRANLLIGPASQLLSESYDEQPELTDEKLVAEIEAKTRRLMGGPAGPLDDADFGDLDIYNDLG
jgi:hypothetical protein